MGLKNVNNAFIMYFGNTIIYYRELADILPILRQEDHVKKSLLEINHGIINKVFQLQIFILSSLK